ncbi:hypothetical protein AGMMS49990_04160 [Endomicrobiia bacterium]|nr:hypothetical protein AGMMS49990_04160 [Endomicrobiia bacterium]
MLCALEEQYEFTSKAAPTLSVILVMLYICADICTWARCVHLGLGFIETPEESSKRLIKLSSSSSSSSTDQM